MLLTELTFIVLFYLCAGTFMSFGLLRPTEVGKKFYTIHGLGAVGLMALSFFLTGYRFQLSESLFWFVFCMIFATAYCLFIGKPKYIHLPLFFLGTLGAVFTILLDLSSHVSDSLYGQAALNSVLSSFLLGFTMTAMLLGHWYLNQPKMSGEELKRITVGYLVLVFLRFFVSTKQLFILFGSVSEAQIYHELLGTTPGIFLVMRYFWGILGPLGLAYFIWGTVKIRSTQSATGILYVAVVFVLIGEIISQYLTFFHGLPV